jgi:hypothetical protein
MDNFLVEIKAFTGLYWHLTKYSIQDCAGIVCQRRNLLLVGLFLQINSLQDDFLEGMMEFDL